MFAEDGSQRWWCDDNIVPQHLVVTDGQDHFAVSDSERIIKLDIRDFDHEVVAVSVTPINSREEAVAAYMQILWD